MKITRVNLVVENPERIDFGSLKRPIIISNHTSLLDIPIIHAAFPEHDIRMAAKKELFTVPIFGRALKIMGYLQVVRGSREKVWDLFHQFQIAFKNRIIPWISPTGTRSNRLGEVKRGAFIIAKRLEATILPVAIIGADQVLPRKAIRCRHSKTVLVIVGTPILALKENFKSRDALIDQSMQSLKELIATKTNHIYS